MCIIYKIFVPRIIQLIKKFPYERLRQIAKYISPVYGQKDCLPEQI